MKIAERLKRKPFPLGTVVLISCFVLLSDLPTAWAVVDSRCARIDARQAYGPYDYRQRRANPQMIHSIELVESAHFKSFHRRGALRGDHRTNVGVRANLDYTLRAFPNHAPALYLLGVFEYQVATNDEAAYRRVQADRYYSPVECYFDRAIKFASNDPDIYNAMGRLHTRTQQFDKAIAAFKNAVKLAPKSPASHYNLGLAYFAASQFEQSAISARKAYALGYKRQDLKVRLKRKGHW